MPTIFNPNNPNFKNSSAVSIARIPPRKHMFQEDQYQRFFADDVIKTYSDINKNLCPSGHLFQQYDD